MHASTAHPEPLISRKRILYLLLALALVRGVIYASVVPPWQAPDEPGQFERARASVTATEWNSTSKNGPAWYDELIRSLFTFGYWDFLDNSRPIYEPNAPLNRYIALYQEIYGGLYGSRPAYALIGWPLFLARDQDIVLQLYLVRLNTVLMNVGIIWLAYLMVRTIFPHDSFLALGVPILILFNPQHTHLLSTVNNGNLAELLATAALYFMVTGVVRGFTWFNMLATVTLSLAAMWTKATAYFLPLAIGSIGLFYLWRYRRRWHWLLPTGLVLVGLGYYFAPRRLWLLISQAWATLQAGGVYLDPIVPLDLFRSFWATPGWFVLLSPPSLYWLPALACSLAVVGLVIQPATKWRLLVSDKELQPRIQALTILAVAILVAIGVLLSWSALTNTIIYRQGRSIFPVIAPICLFLMLGWRELIPYHWREIGLLALSVALFLFDTLILFHYLIPLFYSRH
ncbi:MAG: hypothetical protein HYR94_06150 [Chloroflexi bacterium]|nr:hypothetical protein [Chloroflexota bacterium]